MSRDVRGATRDVPKSLSRCNDADPDQTDDPETTGSRVEESLHRTIKGVDVVDGEAMCSARGSSTQRGADSGDPNDQEVSGFASLAEHERKIRPFLRHPL
jgi:hypothetical protein